MIFFLKNQNFCSGNLKTQLKLKDKETCTHIKLNVQIENNVGLYFRFEEIYNMRIAYKAFEGEDMRGMPLEERMMLGALKVFKIISTK